MKLTVNDKPIELPTGGSLRDLLQQLSLETKKGIAVAVNAEVIAGEDWGKKKLNESDKIIVIRAAQGG
ncbi:MAG: sulfur carrier protein ThiS [Bacteroidota bacterium]